MKKKEKKILNDFSGLVYSTNPELKSDEVREKTGTDEISPAQMDLRIHIVRLGGNKAMSVVTGFTGSESALNALGKELKQKCGTGGSVKDGEILVQGDKRDQMLDYLLKKGYRVKKSGS